MSSLLLALDTATRRASVALCRGEQVLAQASREVTTHSEGLVLLMDETLRQASVTVQQVEVFVCGQGPGSFTGLRIGMATVKGLCLASSRPMVCVCSLLPLALAAGETAEAGQLVAAVLDARRHEIYVGLYRDGAPLAAPTVCPPERLADLVPAQESVILAGDGALAYRDRLLGALGRASMAAEGCHQIEARYLAHAALPRVAAADFDDLHTAVPLYIRATDAKLPALPQDRRGKT